MNIQDVVDNVRRREQYKRDTARLEVRKLDLKDSEFSHLVELAREEIQAHTQHVRERHAGISLHDHDSLRSVVWDTNDTSRLATFVFDPLWHEVTFPSYKFTVRIYDYDNPVATGHKHGQPLGVVTKNTIIDAVRSAIESIFATDATN